MGNKIRKILTLLAVGAFERTTQTFLTTIVRPSRARGVRRISYAGIQTPHTAIVIQGPILTEHDFTLETVRQYRTLFPDCTLIVSTWNNEADSVLSSIRDEGAEIVISSPPDNRGPRNSNMQIVSTRAGVARAKELGALFVLKTRTDQRLYAPDTIPFLITLLDTFPLAKKLGGQQKRIIGASHETLKYRLYGLTDQFQFGTTDDILSYWSAPLDTRLPGIGAHDTTLREAGHSRLTEVYLETEYLKKLGRPLAWTLRDSWQAFADHFIIVDKRAIDLYWFKYDRHKEERLASYVTKATEYLTFRDWVVLHTGVPESCPEYILDLPLNTESVSR